MPSRLIPLVLLFLLLFSLSVNFIQWRQDQSRNRVIAVPDGDSLDLSDGRRIRLLGIDAPERGQWANHLTPRVKPAYEPIEFH